MKYRKLGKSGIKVSAIGMGCWAIGGPFLHPSGRTLAYGQVKDKESIQAIHKGLEMGVTLFDTSNVYGCGRSERVLGKALNGRREEVVIATKFGSIWNTQSDNPVIPCQIIGNLKNVEASEIDEAIRTACEESLDRLQTDYIDIYQLHTANLDFDKAVIVKQTLEELVSEGKIRYYGWSTDDIERAKLFAQGKHCAIVQFRHNLTFHNNKMIKEVIDPFNIAGLIKGPLSGGLLTDKYRDDSEVPKEHAFHSINFAEGRFADIRAILEELRSILTSDGRTPAQAALAWIWAQHDQLIPIPGFKYVKQVEENTRAMEFGPLTKDQMEQIDKIFEKNKQKIAIVK